MTTISNEQLQNLLDEREISRLLVTFSRCIDTKDFDAYAQLYAQDAELVTPWGSHKGREGLAEHVRNDLGEYRALHHVSAGHDINVDGDRATVRATLLATHVTDEEGVQFWSVGGHYEMDLTKDQGHWYLTRVAINPAWRFETTPTTGEQT